ncbi:organelle RRM domain-containing protein 6, chloroplastic isoform X2 [Ziziphus jujuba]|uniref:Organelle RRM domain-containing protein 6, chloroplastic isoform X2 n=1 Tax=Ziziphus jujuba TaxID=326968 RepID=A0ABM3IKR3_ZIZJJ|nr:organelle RRM domain-containing protein 6, chloroplastic isoform X2 [Ziziphus jujuba]
MAATVLLASPPNPNLNPIITIDWGRQTRGIGSWNSLLYSSSTWWNTRNGLRFPSLSLRFSFRHAHCSVSASSSSSSSSSPKASTRLYVSGLSFRTTEDSLRNAFQNFGQLVEVNLVMDRIANRPRGFAFLRYANEEESQKAIKGMHGKEVACNSWC